MKNQGVSQLSIIKNRLLLFCTFFHVQPKHQNGNIFVDIEGFRPCLSKPSYRAPKWALMVRLMQKERLNRPRNRSLIIENQVGLLGHPFGGPFWPKLPFFVIWASHSEPRWTRRKKINETELRLYLGEIRPTGSQAKFSTGGGVAVQLHSGRGTTGSDMANEGRAPPNARRAESYAVRRFRADGGEAHRNALRLFLLLPPHSPLSLFLSFFPPPLIYPPPE